MTPKKIVRFVERKPDGMIEWELDWYPPHTRLQLSFDLESMQQFCELMDYALVYPAEMPIPDAERICHRGCYTDA